MTVFLFPRGFLSQAFKSYLIISTISPQNLLAQEIQAGVGGDGEEGGQATEEQTDILLHFPLTAELSSQNLASNNDVQIKISDGFASPRWNS